MEVKFLDVKQLRTDLGITQLELSKKLNTPQGYLSQVENGKRKPSKNLMEKISKSLGDKIQTDKYWVTKKQQKTIDQNTQISLNDSSQSQLSALEKMISMLEKSQAKVEQLEEEVKFLRQKLQEK